MKVFYVFLLVLVFGVVHSHGRARESWAPCSTHQDIQDEALGWIFLSPTVASVILQCDHKLHVLLSPHISLCAAYGLSWRMVNLLTALERPLIFQKYYTFLRFKNIHACYCYHHSLFIYIVWRLLIYIYIYIYLQINPNTKLIMTKFWPNLFRQNQKQNFLDTWIW